MGHPAHEHGIVQNPYLWKIDKKVPRVTKAKCNHSAEKILFSDYPRATEAWHAIGGTGRARESAEPGE